MRATRPSRDSSSGSSSSGGAALFFVAVAFLRFAALPAQEVLPLPDEQVLVSTNAIGTAAGGSSTEPAISLDGNHVAFQSDAPDIHPNDDDRILDIFLRDVKAGRTQLVTGGPFVPGLPIVKGNGPSRFPSVSERGQLVVFASDATNLVTPDGNGTVTDMFLYDVATGKSSLLSISPAGQAGNGPSDRGAISSNGKVAAFQSRATNLAGPVVPAGIYRIHVVDLETGAMARIDPASRVLADGDSRLPQLSFDGSKVAFESAAANFVPGDSNQTSDVFLHDRETGQTTLVSVADRRRQGNKASGNPRLSGDGRFVAFESLANNLLGGDANGASDVFVRDLVCGRTELASVDPSGRQVPFASTIGGISFDGRFVGFFTRSPLLALDGNGIEDYYVRDRLLGRTFLASATLVLDRVPQAPNGLSRSGAMSGDGLFFAFESLASNLSRLDPNERPDVYRAFVPAVQQGPFPASNHVLLNIDGAIRQFDLAGRATGRALTLDNQSVDGMAVDDLNALWVQRGNSIFRYQALTLEPAQAGARIPVGLGGDRFHGLVAAGGFAWTAIDGQIYRTTADGDVLRFSLPGAGAAPPEKVSLALDPFGRLWACVMRQGGYQLLKLTRDLRLLRAEDRPSNAPLHSIACGADGSVFARSDREIAKLAPSGGMLWTAAVDRGGGLAVDGDGRVYTLSSAHALGFRGDGQLFLRIDNPGIGLSRVPAAMAVDGLGSVYFTEDGSRIVYKLSPGMRSPGEARKFASGAVRGHGGGSDLTGFIAANVNAQKRDADSDGILNRREASHGFNPFDPGSPAAASRLPPILDLTATPLAGRAVRIDWRSATAFDRFYVFRDGRQIAGSPFAFASALAGVTDTNVPGGSHVYRVIGQGPDGRGGGGGFPSGEEGIMEPFSLSEETSVSQGEGSVLSSVSTTPPPDAVAFDASSGRVFAVLEGGILWTLDSSLGFLEETTLPADPFSSSDVRGLAVDPDDAQHPLYILLGDGRMFRRVGNAAPVAIASLGGHPDTPLPEGYTGLAVTSGNGNDLFTTMAGPGVDCLIGFLRTTGIFKSGAEESVRAVLNMPLEYSAGLARFGTGLLAGIGVNLEGAPAAINRVAKLNLGANFAVTDGNASVSLAGLGSSDIPGFDYAPGIGLVVADRAGSRVAMIEALFPGSLQLISVTPNRSRRNAVTPDVQIAGTGFGANPGDLSVKFDGYGITIKSLSGGIIKVDAPALGEAREVMVEVSSPVSTDFLFPGFTYGFMRGDSNDDAVVGLADAVNTLNFLFAGSASPACLDAADTDDTETLDLSDAVYMLNYLFLGTKPQPPPPFPEVGVDPEGDLLGCGA